MSFDQKVVAVVGISLFGLGLIMRKQHTPQWRVFCYGGIFGVAIVILSLIFGWKSGWGF